MGTPKKQPTQKISEPFHCLQGPMVIAGAGVTAWVASIIGPLILSNFKDLSQNQFTKSDIISAYGVMVGLFVTVGAISIDVLYEFINQCCLMHKRTGYEPIGDHSSAAAAGPSTAATGDASPEAQRPRIKVAGLLDEMFFKMGFQSKNLAPIVLTWGVLLGSIAANYLAINENLVRTLDGMKDANRMFPTDIKVAAAVSQAVVNILLITAAMCYKNSQRAQRRERELQSTV